MNRVLKYAWYQLIVVGASIVFAAVTIGALMVWWRGREFNPIIVLWPLMLVHFYRAFFPLKAGEIAFDERDEQIKDRATKISFTVFWYIFIASCIIPIMIIGDGSIHVAYLGGLLLLSGLLMRIVWSVAVIVQYGRSEREYKVEIAPEGGAA